MVWQRHQRRCQSTVLHEHCSDETASPGASAPSQMRHQSSSSPDGIHLTLSSRSPIQPVNSTMHQKLHTTDIIYPSRPEPHSGTANTEEKEHSKAYFFTVITIIVWYSQAHLQRLQSRKSRSWWKPLQSPFSLSVTTIARCMCFVKQITADKYRQWQ